MVDPWKLEPTDPVSAFAAQQSGGHY